MDTGGQEMLGTLGRCATNAKIKRKTEEGEEEDKQQPNRASSMPLMKKRGVPGVPNSNEAEDGQSDDDSAEDHGEVQPMESDSVLLQQLQMQLNAAAPPSALKKERPSNEQQPPAPKPAVIQEAPSVPAPSNHATLLHIDRIPADASSRMIVHALETGIGPIEPGSLDVIRKHKTRHCHGFAMLASKWPQAKNGNITVLLEDSDDAIRVSRSDLAQRQRTVAEDIPPRATLRLRLYAQRKGWLEHATRLTWAGLLAIVKAVSPHWSKIQMLADDMKKKKVVSHPDVLLGAYFADCGSVASARALRDSLQDQRACVNGVHFLVEAAFTIADKTLHEKGKHTAAERKYSRSVDHARLGRVENYYRKKGHGGRSRTPSPEPGPRDGGDARDLSYNPSSPGLNDLLGLSLSSGTGIGMGGPGSTGLGGWSGNNQGLSGLNGLGMHSGAPESPMLSVGQHTPLIGAAGGTSPMLSTAGDEAFNNSAMFRELFYGYFSDEGRAKFRDQWMAARSGQVCSPAFLDLVGKLALAGVFQDQAIGGGSTLSQQQPMALSQQGSFTSGITGLTHASPQHQVQTTPTMNATAMTPQMMTLPGGVSGVSMGSSLQTTASQQTPLQSALQTPLAGMGGSLNAGMHPGMQGINLAQFQPGAIGMA